VNNMKLAKSKKGSIQSTMGTYTIFFVILYTILHPLFMSYFQQAGLGKFAGVMILPAGGLFYLIMKYY